ncbi:MMPL family transporter [Solirubrobacter sp. CPCC 204708]|uniref:MMPL family transporter n=1 Tax=Solirubrobacter deserti TaxID=2282478 RepID=A0ABT4RSZ5_9ACTN|nr:MMPL family transporter [Solirubrobacter deserti]MBE2315894.1 MMPL family transporter [Solirubrobacter deserti]MDA0141575.1 MMPL family transporter [Solirubrobacter deserti]
MSQRFAAVATSRAAWLVFVLWLVVIGTSVGLGIPEKYTAAQENESTSFLPGDAESTKALTAAEELQGGELAPAIILYRRESGLTAADRQKIVTDVEALTAQRFPGVVADGATAAAGGQQGEPPPDAPPPAEGCGTPVTPIPGQPSGYAPFVGPVCSMDGKAALVFAYLRGDGESSTILDPVDFWRETVSDPGGGLEVKITGGAGYAADAISVFENINGTLLFAATLLVIVLLILIYRSPVFLFIPLAAVLFAEFLSQTLGYALAEAGVTINGQSSAIMSILVLGAGTDYALLIVARYREEMHHRVDKYAAMRAALISAGPAVFASAATVIAALFCLSIARVNGTSGLGPLGALGVFCAALSMLTLLPALLLIFGRRAFWPFVPHTPDTRPAGEELSGSSVAAFGKAAGACLLVALLLPLSLVLTLIRRIFGTPSLVSWLDSRVFTPYELRRVRHEHLVDETHGFWKRVGDRVAVNPRRTFLGAIAVLGVMCLGLLFFSTDLTTNDSYRTKVESIEGQELLAKSFPAGSGAPTDIIVADAADVERVSAAVADVPGVQTVSPPVASDDSGRTMIQATLEPPPYSTEAFELIEPIRAAVGDAALVGGATAVEFDVREAAAWDSLVIPPIVLLVVFVILMVLLRAVVGPLVLIGTVILSYAAALGVSYFVFDVVFGFVGSDPSLPLFGFVFLVALGVDYNIFLAARAREETWEHGTRKGMLRALAVTGGVITSAGIVLAGTFAVLGSLPLVFLTEIGFVVAFGVLLDTFLVRSVLVPAATLLIGPKFWWPSSLAKTDGAPRDEERVQVPV